LLHLLFSKTEAGRAEIRSRSLPLSRAARNLLLVIDASKPAQAWLQLVQGVGPADLQALQESGLIASLPVAAGAAPAVAPAPAPPAGRLSGDWARAPAPVAVAPAPSQAAPPALDRAQLYTYLSGEATKLLGPFKGYAFALEVERCDSLAELQALAAQLVERVQRAKGDEAAAAVRQALHL
jgi:hypothetical protein